MANPQQEQIKLVRQVRKDLNNFFTKAVQIYGGDELILELMRDRKYTTMLMFDTLKEVGIFRCSSIADLTLVMPDLTTENLKNFGLLTDTGDYLLKDRYVLPIRDIQGDITALVGWHPMGGSRKYITTPTTGFSRDATFFNYDQAFKLAHEKFNGVVFQVEGIFDTLALRAIGLPAQGMQGLELSAFKSKMLNRYSKVVNIPDGDNSGRGTIPYLNKMSGKSEKLVWRMDVPHVYVALPLRHIEVKDTDDLVNKFDCYDDLIALIDKKYVVHLKLDD